MKLNWLCLFGCLVCGENCKWFGARASCTVVVFWSHCVWPAIKFLGWKGWGVEYWGLEELDTCGWR